MGEHKMKKGFEVGKSIHAKWPGSGGYYYPAEIIDFDSVENFYSVKFAAGGEYVYRIPAKEMFVSKLSSEEGRREKKARSRSRSCSRSRSRSRSRNRVQVKERRSLSKSPEGDLPKSSLADVLPTPRSRGRSRRVVAEPDLDAPPLGEKEPKIEADISKKFDLDVQVVVQPISIDEELSRFTGVIETITHSKADKSERGSPNVALNYQNQNCQSHLNEAIEETISNQDGLSNSSTPRLETKPRTSVLGILLNLRHLLVPLLILCILYFAGSFLYTEYT